MMVAAQSTLDAPVTKGTTGVVVLERRETPSSRIYPSIHCEPCLEAWPMFLNPSLLGDLAKVGRYQAMAEAHLGDCMLCGLCAYVCPSNIPLSQLFFAAKSALKRESRPAA